MYWIIFPFLSFNIKWHTKTHAHTLSLALLRLHWGPQPHLPLSDSWLLNKDSGNIIKSFTFDTQPALKLINSPSVCRNCINQVKREEFCILWGQSPSLSFHLIVPCCSSVLRECFSSWPVLTFRPHQLPCLRVDQTVAEKQALLTPPFHLVCLLHLLWCGKATAVNIITVTWHQKYPLWRAVVRLEVQGIISTYSDMGCDVKSKYVKCYQARGKRPQVPLCLLCTVIRQQNIILQ